MPLREVVGVGFAVSAESGFFDAMRVIAPSFDIDEFVVAMPRWAGLGFEERGEDDGLALVAVEQA